ncbi:MAG: helix-turn-helix transcriptional regulator [Cellulosilyticum sp.]|nr:helix-turn-helix transcriptional regulator [Cellulosilyticum sp.]
MDKEKTGNLIKQLRVKKGYTQQELANKLNVTNKAVSRWENGNSFPDITLLDNLASILDISITELIRGKRETEDEEHKVEQSKEYIVTQVVEEAKVQKKKEHKKILYGLIGVGLLGVFLVILCNVFFVFGYSILVEEANLEEARVTFAYFAFAALLIFMILGIPVLGLCIFSIIALKTRDRKSKIISSIFVIIFILWLAIYIVNRVIEGIRY